MRAAIFIIAAATLAAFVPVSGCFAEAASGEAASSGERAAATEPAAPSAQAAAPLAADYLNKVQSRLGFSLIHAIDKQRKGNGEANVIVSPASLAGVLALLDVGANAEMRAALIKTLGFEQGPDDASSSKLAALRASAKSVQADANGALTAAQAIVFDPKSRPYADIKAELAAAGAEISEEDLSNPAGIARINDWVKAHTAGLIPSIIDKAPREAGLVALNALHFKDRWKDAFDPGLTKPGRFHGAGGTETELPMMQREGNLQVREEGEFVALELPYATDRFRLVLITTRQKPARAAAFGRVADWLNGEGFAQQPGEVSMPRLELGTSADLLNTLDELGLRRGRVSPGALARLSRAPTAIAQVLQRTRISIDETGTEAAAATAVTTTRAVIADFVKLTFDKPFLFALRDTQSGLVLLAGYVGNPKHSAS
jgi:serpin B